VFQERCNSAIRRQLLQTGNYTTYGLASSLIEAPDKATPSPNDSRCGDNFCYFLDLRGEASLRIRATAKPIITSTPRITSANLTGRDYLKANADFAQ
jgi:hypothetical protein